MARDPTTVPFKKWSEYTHEEKQALEKRWTEEKVEEVVETLRKGLPMPDYVPTLLVGFRADGGIYAYDLRGITLRDRDLDSVSLRWAWLQGADLGKTSLKGANLYRADLEEARLWLAELHGAELGHANLRDALLWAAKLQGARLGGAGLQGADFRGARLQGAVLLEADLVDANLSGAVFDSTHLTGANLGSARNIRFVIWGDRVKPRYIIGEEVEIRSSNEAIDSLESLLDSLEATLGSLKAMKDCPAMTIDSLEKRIIDAVRVRDNMVRSRRDSFLRAELTYRDLKTFYKKELLDDVAMEFHFRENEVRTEASAQYVRPLRVLFLKWTYGYGSRPVWLLRYSLAVIGLFSLIFALLTIPRKTGSGIYLTRPGSDQKDELLPFRKGRLFLDCFYFSLLSFATFGYGALQPRQWIQFFRLEAVEYKPVRWARIFVGIEAALGIWVFALLVTVLFGK